MSPSLTAMLPASLVPLLQWKQLWLLCGIMNPMELMGIPLCIVLLGDRQQQIAQRQGLVMSLSPIWRCHWWPQAMLLAGGVWVRHFYYKIWYWCITETLRTVPCACTNGLGLSTNSELHYTFWTRILKCFSHRFQAVQPAYTRHVWGLASFEECLPSSAHKHCSWSREILSYNNKHSRRSEW